MVNMIISLEKVIPTKPQTTEGDYGIQSLLYKCISKIKKLILNVDTHIAELIKGRFLLFQVYRNLANLFFKLSVSTFYKEISKFQQKVQS